MAREFLPAEVFDAELESEMTKHSVSALFAAILELLMDKFVIVDVATDVAVTIPNPEVMTTSAESTSRSSC